LSEETTREIEMDDETRDIFVTGLRNAYAMENQALAIMKPQVSRIENYPEVAAKLEQHIRERKARSSVSKTCWPASTRTIRH
jgi:ferritin-like metal-binding protein YciE